LQGIQGISELSPNFLMATKLQVFVLVQVTVNLSTCTSLVQVTHT